MTNITGNVLTFDFTDSDWRTKYPESYTVTDGTYAWYTADTFKYNEKNTLRSYAIADKNKSELTINFTLVAAGKIQFNYRVGSEKDYDKLHVKIDDAEVLVKSGNVAWTDYTQDLGIGSHSIYLYYEKDASGKTDPDCAAIGYMTITGITPAFARKWLIKAGSNYYNSAGTQVAITTLNNAAFTTHGSDEKPTSEVLKSFTNPSVLYWQDNNTLSPPAYYATITGAPPLPQEITTDNILMNDISILGIQSMTATGSDDLLFSISYDDGTTWTVSEVTLAAFNALTDFGSNRTQYKIKVKLPAATSHIDSLIIKYTN